MSDINKIIKDYQASKERLRRSSAPSVIMATVDDQPVMHWEGRVVSADIYIEPIDNEYSAEVSCNGSTKLITGKSPAELRNTIFWIDRCMTRFVADSAIFIIDYAIPF